MLLDDYQPRPSLHRRVYDNQARMVIDTDKAKGYQLIKMNQLRMGLV